MTHVAGLLGGIFTDTWHTLKLHGQKLLLITLFLWVGGRAITYGFSHYFSDLPLQFTHNEIVVDEEALAGQNFEQIWTTFQPFILSGLLVSLLALLILMLVQIIITKLALETKEYSFQELINFAGEKIGPYVGTSFLQTIFLFFLFLLFIIPGVIYSIYRLFTNIEVVAGDLTYKQAMNESKRLVKGRWWITLLYLICLVAGIAIIQLLLNMLITYIPDTTVVHALISLLGRCVQIIITLLMTHFYLARRKTAVPGTIGQEK